MGGENVSLTRGVVSRVDVMDYSFSRMDADCRLLVLQIDAAINPGKGFVTSKAEREERKRKEGG